MNAQAQTPKVMKPIVHFTKPTEQTVGHIPLDTDKGHGWRRWVSKYRQRLQARADRKRRLKVGHEPEKIGSRRFNRYIGTI